MNCMKCGRDIESDQVFCPVCLEDMQKYPVKPNIAIQLPHREDILAVKKAPVKRRQAPSAEEKFQTAKRFLRRVVILWLITLGLLIASLYPAVQFFLGNAFRPSGQNYSTFSTEPAQSSTPTDGTAASVTP